MDILYSNKLKRAISNKLMGEDCRSGKEKGQKKCMYKLVRAFVYERLIKMCNWDISKLGKAGGTTSLTTIYSQLSITNWS